MALIFCNLCQKQHEGWDRTCPKCGKGGSFHLMMAECDDCINNAPKPPPSFVEKNGLLVPNPDLRG
jgi:predicted amidophosphoribosyltransferase